MATTTRMAMDKLTEGQRGKEVTINEALDAIDFAMYKDLGETTLASLPPASSHPNAWILVTNASGGRTVCRSNGTAWKVIAVEGATVS